MRWLSRHYTWSQPIVVLQAIYAWNLEIHRCMYRLYCISTTTATTRHQYHTAYQTLWTRGYQTYPQISNPSSRLRLHIRKRCERSVLTTSLITIHRHQSLNVTEMWYGLILPTVQRQRCHRHWSQISAGYWWMLPTQPTNHPLHKLFNRNNLKLSYSCVPNVRAQYPDKNPAPSLANV
jgi:hypothetical protein